MALKDRADSRPVNVGDLVALQWYPDPDYYIGEVGYGYTVRNPGGAGSIHDAYHVVKLMDADEWTRLISSMGDAAFVPIAQRFPMVTTGDFGPEETIKLEQDLKQAVLTWLHWNYPGLRNN